MGELRAPRRHHDAAELRHGIRGDAPAGGFRRDVPVLRGAARSAARAVRRVRPQAQGRARVREIPGVARLHPQPEGLEMTRRCYIAGWQSTPAKGEKWL